MANKKPFPYGKVVVDYETDGLDPYIGSRPFIAGLEDEAGNVIKARPGEPAWNRIVKPIIEDPNIEKVSHGSKFEIKMSKHSGMTPRGKFHDTMALAVLTNEYQRLSLGWLSEKHLKDKSKDIVQDWLKANARSIKKARGREPNYTDVPKWLLEKYLEGDLDKTLRLFWCWYDRVQKDNADLYEMETDLAYDIAEMEDHGIWIDMPFCIEQVKRFTPMRDELIQKMIDLAGVKFNPGSRIQLDEVLSFMDINIEEKNKDGTMKTQEKYLEPFGDNEFIATLLRWRAVNKILGTYLVPFTQKANGNVIHGNIWQYGRDDAIVTGRLSSSGPNLQNIPGVGSRGILKDLLVELAPAVRRSIIPPPGHAMVFFDYKQIEMIIFTCLAGDPQAIADLKKGEDVYIAHGKLLLGKNAFDGVNKFEYKKRRALAKEISLSLVYGMGLKALARKLKTTMFSAKRRKDTYFNNSPSTRRFMISTTRDLLQNGYVKDIYGRKYHVPKEQAYKSVNGICQGTSATAMKKGILAARPLRDIGARPMLTVHDELIVTCPINKVKEVAQEGKKLIESQDWPFEVPLRVDVEWSDKSWADKMELKL